MSGPALVFKFDIAGLCAYRCSTRVHGCMSHGAWMHDYAYAAGAGEVLAALQKQAKIKATVDEAHGHVDDATKILRDHLQKEARGTAKEWSFASLNR